MTFECDNLRFAQNSCSAKMEKYKVVYLNQYEYYLTGIKIRLTMTIKNQSFDLIARDGIFNVIL